MAILIDEDGKVTEIKPEDGKSFHCPELYKLLECQMVEVLQVGRNKRTRKLLEDIEANNGVKGAVGCTIMIIDEEGKLTGKDYNVIGTDVWAATWDTVNMALLRTGDHIVGKVILCTSPEFR